MKENIFFDTSALVKIYYPEKGSDKIEEWVEQSKKIFISKLTSIEFHSTLYRKYRDNTIEEVDLQNILKVFNSDLKDNIYEIINIDDKMLKAVEIIKNNGKSFGIKTLDALQLASAMSLKNFLFVTSDIRLSNLIKALGINTVNPEE